MCEIAILKKEDTTMERVADAAVTLYESQRTALGIVAASIDDGKYSYETFRSTEPTEAEIGAFIKETWDDAVRYIVHGRLATSGERDNEGTHPISIDCPECDIDYVLHNGVVGNIQMEKRQTESTGHEWTTTVDSELIAHTMGRVPESHEQADELLDTYAFLTYQPAFVLLNSERIYVFTRSQSRYEFRGAGQLSCSHRNWATGELSSASRYILRAQPRAKKVTA